LQFKKEQSCPFCRRPNENGLTCRTCHEHEQKSLDGCLTAGNYNDLLLSHLIKACKYSFAKELIPIIGSYLFCFCQNNISYGDNILTNKNKIIVPIPLHAKRLNWRGFNQAELLANYLAEKFQIDLVPNLARIKNNPPQAKLTEEKRRINISGCFSWIGESLSGKKIILIDDVATTGSTLDEAARVLKIAGAAKVFAITAAGG
jgi:ComF family protein